MDKSRLEMETRFQDISRRLLEPQDDDDVSSLLKEHQELQEALAKLRSSDLAKRLTAIAEELSVPGITQAVHAALISEQQSIQAELTSKRKWRPSPASSGTPTSPGGVQKKLEKAKRERREIPGDQLPSWPDDQRGMPNEMLRSSFVTARQSGPRVEMKGTVIATNAGRTMLYWGEELRKKDEDVLLEIYHRQRGQPLGTPIICQPKDFLRSMRWPDSGRSYTELYECLERIQRASIHFKLDEDGTGRDYEIIQGPLLTKLRIAHYESVGLREIEVTVNPQTRDLWTAYHYTLIDFETRLQLSGPLAPFMHRYYSSHRKPFPVSVAYLQKLCGSGTTSLARFKQSLKEALQQLVDVGFLSGFFFDSSNKVHVVRRSDELAEGLVSQ